MRWRRDPDNAQCYRCAMTLRRFVRVTLTSIAIAGAGQACDSNNQGTPPIAGSATSVAIMPSTAPPVIDVPSEDPKMTKAITAARATLTFFTNELKTPKPDHVYTVKRPFKTPSGSLEHMWLRNAKFDGQSFSGTLDNEPRDAKARVGATYAVSKEQVSDWMISDAKGRIYGGYTIRALLSTMPEANRKALKQALQPLPSATP